MGQPKKIEVDDFDSVFADELEPGHSLMHGQYTIEEFLNAGGFGITYLARDSLDRIVVIKECFPGSLCRRTTSSVQARSRAHTTELSSIVRLFVEEARSLARLDHPNIVGVHQVFEENNTAYMALDYVEGRDLLDMIEKPDEILEPEEAEAILRKLLGAVGFIHDQGILHRDISPDNVLIQPNMEPILIDFGAAREEAGKKSRILSAMRVVKDGYSPQEFYISGAEQGQFSDLYALGATFYHLITGELPANSQSRLAAVASGEADPYIPVADRMPAYSDQFLCGIDKALAVLPKDRIASAANWISLLDGEATVDTAPVQQAGPKNATAKHGKSKSRLLGTVAILAPILVFGGIAYSQFGPSQTDPVTVPVTVQTQQTETTAPVDVATLDVVELLTTSADNTATEIPTQSTEVSVTAQPATPVVAVASVPEGRFVPEAYTPVVPAASVPDDRFVPEAYTPPQPAPVVSEIALSDSPSVQTPAATQLASQAPAIRPDTTTTDAIAPQAQANQIVEVIQPAAPPVPEVVQPVAVTVDPSTLEIYDLPNVVTGWSVDVSAKLQNPTDTVFEIDGVPIDTVQQIDTVMRNSFAAPNGGQTQVSILAGSDQASATYETVFVPVVQKTLFPNGTMFETRVVNGDWTTTVIAAPSSTGFRQGDVLLGDLAVGVLFDTRTSLPDLLVKANAEDLGNFTLAVRRSNDVVAVGFAVPR